ncbi:hypothetical protein KOM00_11240 [Geomonas sp. Red69]|uniref:Uncharacterized protein n=1 Tax=Geomonas diazotrophica TaxID=2843197 RepID=A0ABX8JQ96_9BACT|nr:MULTISPECIES: hypothetical protein [Geomonas]MBU5637305.1 hypothetical protein [Geomonas diazotrophica]QWV99592.1 hypothetical protein KP005_10080 [Geomonas nitrogeniifigens]
MRRVSEEEDILKDRPVVGTEETEICALCGSQLQRDKESGELFCPLCDVEDVP